jgi:hypothetical protein
VQNEKVISSYHSPASQSWGKEVHFFETIKIAHTLRAISCVKKRECKKSPDRKKAVIIRNTEFN